MVHSWRPSNKELLFAVEVARNSLCSWWLAFQSDRSSSYLKKVTSVFSSHQKVFLPQVGVKASAEFEIDAIMRGHVC